MNIVNILYYISKYFSNKLYLNNNTLLNYITSNNIVLDNKCKYIEHMEKNMQIDYNLYRSSSLLKQIQFKNIQINFDDKNNPLSIFDINKFNNISGIVNLKIINLNNLKIFYNILASNINTISSIKLVCCNFTSSFISFYDILYLYKLYKYKFLIKFDYNTKSFNLDNISNLIQISLEYCNDNAFKIFSLQKNIKKLTVKSNIFKNGFSEKYFNKILNSNKISELTLLGFDTNEYINFNNLPFDIVSINTTYLTYYLYNKKNRLEQFKYKNGYLKNLIIHHLPFDFDGGNILKYIIEEMNLDTFNYGNISLIKNNIKQCVTDFEASEYHVTSIYEMFKQYNTIMKFTLNLNTSIVIHKKIFKEIQNNKNLNIFDNLTTLVINDNSANVHLLRLFINFIKQLYNIKKIIINTQDIEINNILENIQLKNLLNLEEISLSLSFESLDYIDTDRLKLIKNNVPKLKRITTNFKHILE